MKHIRHRLAKVIGEKTLHTTDASELAREIAAYLLLENDTAELESLVRDVMEYRLHQGYVEATLVSAHEVGDQVTEDVRAILHEEYPKAKKIIIRERQEPSVVGGVLVELPNEQLDLTVRSKLNIFKRLTMSGKE